MVLVSCLASHGGDQPLLTILDLLKIAEIAHLLYSVVSWNTAGRSNIGGARMGACLNLSYNLASWASILWVSIVVVVLRQFISQVKSLYSDMKLW